MSEHRRYRCLSCDEETSAENILHGVNPFDPDGKMGDPVLLGCPHCFAAGTGAGFFVALCDEPGCDREASTGWPTKDGGYRHTCFQHGEWRGEHRASDSPPSSPTER